MVQRGEQHLSKRYIPHVNFINIGRRMRSALPNFFLPCLQKHDFIKYIIKKI